MSVPQVGFKPNKASIISMHAGYQWRYSSQDWTQTPYIWWGVGGLMSCSDTSKNPLRPSQKVWQSIWSNMETMRLYLPPTRVNTLAPWAWASYRNFLRTGGWPVIGPVWHQRINTPFTPNIHITLSINSRRKTYKFYSRCSGGSTKTCGLDGCTLILCTRVRQGVRM